MTTIYKYPLLLEHVNEIRMPQGATILSVQTQGEKQDVSMWAIVDTDKTPERRTFVIFGTGHSFHLMDYKYLGTVQFLDGELVYHVFETTL